MRGVGPLKDCYCKGNNCHETKISARKTAGRKIASLLAKSAHFTAKGPIGGPFAAFRRLS